VSLFAIKQHFEPIANFYYESKAKKLRRNRKSPSKKRGFLKNVVWGMFYA